MGMDKIRTNQNLIKENEWVVCNAESERLSPFRIYRVITTWDDRIFLKDDAGFIGLFPMEEFEVVELREFEGETIVCFRNKSKEPDCVSEFQIPKSESSIQ